MQRPLARALGAVLIVIAAAIPAGAQDKPRSGGELVFVVPSEPPSYDAHQEETFGVIHPMAPHYSTLLRVDPTDKTGTKPVGDIAESWTISKDGLTYTFKIRRGVKFHDGAELTSKDVKATYEKILKPPAGVKSLRKEAYESIASIDAPDAGTFVEHVKGSHWIGKRNPDYWDKGKPYLDGYRAIFMSSSAAQVAAIRGERAHIQFRGFSPADRDALVQALGSRIVVQESPWNCAQLVTMNHERKPFDDKRVRRALTLALDRHEASRNLSRITVVKEVGGIQVPGTPWATPAAELEKLAGYGRDIAASRAEARRLLREAGVPEGFAFTFKNRGVPQPYEPIGIWLIDQWRQIGVSVKMETIEASAHVSMLRRGDFEVASDAQCSFIVEPDIDIQKFQSTGISDNNYSRYKDPVLDDLFLKQARAVDPEERKRYLRAFEKRLLDEEVHYLYTLQWHRIVAHNARVRGWTITPSHFLNQQLDGAWLAEEAPC